MHTDRVHSIQMRRVDFSLGSHTVHAVRFFIGVRWNVVILEPSPWNEIIFEKIWKPNEKSTFKYLICFSILSCCSSYSSQFLLRSLLWYFYLYLLNQSYFEFPQTKITTLINRVCFYWWHFINIRLFIYNFFYHS